jgi:hypothetical protein
MHRGYPAVERRGHGGTGALGMWPVGSRELCRPRTEVEGKLVTQSDLSLRAPAQVADLLPDVLDVDQGRDGADLGVLRAL